MEKPQLTPGEVSALQHWSSYGQPGIPSEKRVTALHWKHLPFDKPVSSPWNVPISPEQFPSLLMGFQPKEMEDKWFVYADGPNDEGHAVVHFFRSWTGFKISEISIDKDVNKGAEGAMRINGIIWESSQEKVRNCEEGAKNMVREVCRWILGVELPADERK